MPVCSVTQSCPTLCDPIDCSCQAPLLMGCPRQGCWSGLPFPSPGDLFNPGTERVSLACPELQADFLPLHHWGSPVCVYAHTHTYLPSLVTQSCLTLWNPMDSSPPGSSVQGDSPGKNTGVGCHALLQGISQFKDRTQVSLIAGGFFTVWATREAQEKWVAYPFFRGSFQPRNQTGISCIAGRLFTSWATRDRLPTPVFLPEESPWTEEPGGLQSTRLERVGHDWATKHSIYVCMCVCMYIYIE